MAIFSFLSIFMQKQLINFVTFQWESDELSWIGHSLRSAIRLPAQVVKSVVCHCRWNVENRRRNQRISPYDLWKLENKEYEREREREREVKTKRKDRRGKITRDKTGCKDPCLQLYRKILLAVSFFLPSGRPRTFSRVGEERIHIFGTSFQPVTRLDRLPSVRSLYRGPINFQWSSGVTSCFSSETKETRKDEGRGRMLSKVVYRCSFVPLHLPLPLFTRFVSSKEAAGSSGFFPPSIRLSISLSLSLSLSLCLFLFTNAIPLSHFPSLPHPETRRKASWTDAPLLWHRPLLPRPFAPAGNAQSDANRRFSSFSNHASSIVASSPPPLPHPLLLRKTPAHGRKRN